MLLLIASGENLLRWVWPFITIRVEIIAPEIQNEMRWSSKLCSDVGRQRENGNFLLIIAVTKVHNDVMHVIHSTDNVVDGKVE